MSKHSPDYVRTFELEYLRALCSLAQCTGIALNSTALTSSSETQSQNTIDTTFNNPSFAVEDTIEQVIRSIARLSSDCLQGASHVFRNSFASPAVVAPLVRSSLEHSTLVVHLNNKRSPEERAYFTLRFLLKKAKGEDELHLLTPSADNIQRAIEDYERNSSQNITTVDEHEHKEKSNFKHEKLPSPFEMISNEMKLLDGRRLYSTLSTYTHHHAWMAYKTSPQLENEPESLDLLSIKMLSNGIRAADLAARSFESFRDEGQFRAEIENLNQFQENTDLCVEYFNDWQLSRGVTDLLHSKPDD